MIRQKRVCEISGSYFLRDPRVRREAEALADAGWQVDVICLRGANEPATSEYGSAIHIVRVPLGHQRGRKVRYMLEYAAFLALAGTILSLKHLRRQYDLIHIHNMPDAYVFAAWLPKATGTPIVLDIHDAMPETYQARFGISPGHPLNRALLWQERTSFAFADQLITIHELMIRLLLRSAPAEKFCAVMNVPDPKIFMKMSVHERSPHDGLILLYTGTITYHYGLDVAVHAVAKMRGAIPNVCLRIVGDGDDLERIKELAANLDLGNHVEFLPPVSVDRIPEMLATADVSVSPHREDPVAPCYFGTKIVEALLLGVPVISSRTEALAYYFDETMIAFIEPGNADELAAQAIRLHREPGLGKRMVANAQAFFAEHSWEQEREHFYGAVERTQLISN